MPGVGGAVRSSLLVSVPLPGGGGELALYGKNSKASSNGKWGVGNSD